MNPRSKSAATAVFQASPPLFEEDLSSVLERTRDLWEGLRNQRIFVTGGTGFFGRWLLESFLYANRELGLASCITLLTRDPASFVARVPHAAGDPAVSLVQGDVKNFAFPTGEYSHIIHGAAESSTIGSDRDPESMFSTIVDGTRQVLDFAAAAGTRRLLFVSTGAVYGPQPPNLERLSEEYSGAPPPTDARSAYGEAKRAGELLCVLRADAGGTESMIARCFAFVGPHLPLDGHFAVGNFIRDALEKRPVEVAGDGTPFRSYLYAADLAVWLWTILFKGRAGRPYNVGSEEAISIADLAGAVASLEAPALEVRVVQRANRGAIAPRYVPCVRRAREELGLGQTVSQESALRRTMAWWRACGQGRIAHGQNGD